MHSLRITFAALALLAGCGNATNGTDAATTNDDGGVDAFVGTSDAGSTANGVLCGATDCGAMFVCCASSMGIECVAPMFACGGTRLACDGPEDCANGAQCCNDATGNTSCSTSACTGYHICHVDADCAAGESCCPNGGGQPLGSYQHCTTLAPGMTCPLPP